MHILAASAPFETKTLSIKDVGAIDNSEQIGFCVLDFFIVSLFVVPLAMRHPRQSPNMHDTRDQPIANQLLTRDVNSRTR